ncbi:MAG TPA: hypothetical protein PK640_04665 [Verrucomicrobiota bacterium]|nr:hypothetical protein [Verrucomicrobiota bacterium]
MKESNTHCLINTACALLLFHQAAHADLIFSNADLPAGSTIEVGTTTIFIPDPVDPSGGFAEAWTQEYAVSFNATEDYLLTQVRLLGVVNTSFQLPRAYVCAGSPAAVALSDPAFTALGVGSWQSFELVYQPVVPIPLWSGTTYTIAFGGDPAGLEYARATVASAEAASGLFGRADNVPNPVFPVPQGPWFVSTYGPALEVHGTPVPEPAGATLLGGLGLLVFAVSRRNLPRCSK